MIGIKLLDRYELTSVLGRGGMGVVYRARDPRLERDVAVKMIPPAVITAEAESRFRREAQLVARLDHPAITPIFDFGVHEGSLFLVMPVLSGRTLDILIRERNLRLGETLEIIAQAADALDYSHQHGVLHRDVKPENLMILGEPGESPRVRIMDFGLAVAARDDRLTRTGQIFGTLAYVSPERAASSADEDARSDIYSLATVLYECLAGEPPFSGSPTALLYRIVHEHPRSFRERGVIIDQALEWIVLGCLAKAPEDRLQRGHELASALRRYNENLDGVDDGQTVQMPVVPAAMRTAHAPAALVGRSVEVLALQQRLNAATSGAGQLVIIGGEPGIGKTRLVEELITLASARGVPIYHGRFSEHEATFPYQGFCEVIQDYFQRQSRSGVRSDRKEVGSWAQELRATFPMLSEVAAIADVESQVTLPPRLTAERPEQIKARRAKIFEVLARSLMRIGGGEPLVVVLDQLHNADVSVEALQYVAHRLSTTPILLVATYRTNEVARGHELHRLLSSFEGDSSFEALIIRPLSRDEHGALLGSLVGEEPVSEDLASKLYATTEGNPFFTQELVRSSIDSGGIARDQSGMWILSGEAAMSSDALPETIHQVVRARLERLPARHRKLLVTASVLGRSLRYDDLEALVADIDGLSEGDEKLGDDVDSLVGAGLLVEEADRRDDVLRFASTIVRDVLYMGMGRRRRRRLHRCHAERLEERWAGRLERIFPQLLHHFAEADCVEQAIRYGLAHARTSIDGFRVGEAIRTLATVLELAADADGEASPGAEAEAHTLMAQASRAAGQLDLALRHADQSRIREEAVPRPGAAARAALLAAEIAWQARRVEQARRRIDKGLALARDGDDPPTLMRLLELGAMVANLQGQHEVARQLLAEAEVAQASDPDTAGDGVVEGGRLVTVVPNPLTKLEPGHHGVIDDSEVMANVFETLVTSDEAGLPLPMLSAFWEVFDEGRRFRFGLRPEACFSDGTTVTAQHVKASLQRSALGGPEAMEVPAFDAIKGVEDFRAGEATEIAGIVAEDDETVSFVLDEPLPILPVLLSDPGTGIALSVGEGLPLLGTGPFRLGRQTPRWVDLERNPNFWGGTPPLIETLRFCTDLDSAGIAESLWSGELDIGRDLRPAALTEIQRDQRFRGGLAEITKRNVYFLLLNRFGPSAHSDGLRAALFGAIRVQDIVWRTLGRFAQPSVCLIPPGILGHDPGRRPQPRNREDTQAQLASCGLALPIRLRAGIHPQWMDRYEALTRGLFDEWASYGIEVEVVASTLEDYLPLAKAPEGVDLLFGRWFADYDDPDNFTYGLLHSQAGHYRGFWGSDQADALMERARLESRNDVRQRLYRKFERLLVEERVLMPMFHDIDYRIAGPRVRRMRMRNRAPFVNFDSLGLVPSNDPVESSVRSFPERGSLRIPLPGRMTSLDPCASTVSDTAEVIPIVFETLVRVEDGARMVPWLASEVNLAPGAMRLHLKLRDDVRFHDDRHLTVRDVRYSFERILRCGDDHAASSLLILRGARAFRDGRKDEIAGFEIRSAHELVLSFERPCGFFPLVLAMSTLAIVPDGSTRFGGNWRSGCAGTGPFRLVNLDPDERVELEVNPEYWRQGYPRCKRLIFELGSSTERTVAEVRSGRLAIAGFVTPAALERLCEDTDLARGYKEAPGLGTYYLLFNSRKDPLADERVRRALAAAIDGDAIVAAAGRFGTPAHGLIPPGLLGHAAAPRSSALSAAELAPLNGLRLSVSLAPVYRDQYAEIWARVAEAWQAAGVQVEVVQAVDGSDPEFAGVADVMVTRWLASYPDPDTFASLFHSEYGADRVYCANAAIDALIEAGRHELDAGLRNATYRKLDQQLVREARVVPMFHEQVVRIARPEVVGLRVGMRLPEVAYEELTRLL